MQVFRTGAIVVALLGGVSLAVAQTTSPGSSPSASPGASSSMSQVNLTQQQKQKIWQSLASASGQTAPAGFTASEGATVPQQVNLQPLPQTASADLPSNARNMQYAKMQDQILIVDPSDRKVVEVIKQSDAMGASGSSPSGSSPSGTSR